MTNLNRLFTLGDPYSCKEYKTRAYKERIRKKNLEKLGEFQVLFNFGSL